jgi:hypothetical protein
LNNRQTDKPGWKRTEEAEEKSEEKHDGLGIGECGLGIKMLFYE